MLTCKWAHIHIKKILYFFSSPNLETSHISSRSPSTTLRPINHTRQQTSHPTCIHQSRPHNFERIHNPSLNHINVLSFRSNVTPSKLITAARRSILFKQSPSYHTSFFTCIGKDAEGKGVVGLLSMGFCGLRGGRNGQVRFQTRNTLSSCINCLCHD